LDSVKGNAGFVLPSQFQAAADLADKTSSIDGTINVFRILV